MLKTFTYLSFPLLCAMLLFSCKGNEDKEPEPTVIYAGEIELYSESGLKEADYSGVEVTVLGTEPLVKGYTDAKGKFSIEGVPLGRRRASFSKPGYGTFITPEYNYRIEDGSNYNRFFSGFKIGQVSTSVITEVTATIEGERVAVTGKITPAATYEKPRQREIFLSRSSNVSKDKYELAIGTLSSLSGTFKDVFDITFLKERGFASGERLYMVVHGNTVKADVYKHPETGVEVFPALNPAASNVVSIVLP